MIRGPVDRFIHHNPRVILRHLRPHMDPPSQDPYLFPHLYVQGQISSDSSPEDFFDAPNHFPNREHLSQYYSDDNSQHHTNPPPEYFQIKHKKAIPLLPFAQDSWFVRVLADVLVWAQASIPHNSLFQTI